MTPEERELLEKLQPFLRERMGLWQVGDWGIRSSDKKILLFQAGSHADEWHDVLRLPLPIDLFRPERGLWGMIDWSRFEICSIDKGGMMRIGGYVNGKNLKAGIFEHTGTPYLALLRALWEQVKGE